MGWAARPDIMGTAGAVSAGHPLAAQAAMQVLQAGGNAVDAGVTGGICLAVVHPDIVGFAGVAPTLVFDAAADEAVSVVGVGPWPARASVEFFRRECGGEIPDGLLRTVVPGGPDAWITLLERHGTIGFAEAVAPAIRLAREGFPMGRFVAQTIAQYEDAYRRWPASAAIFLPHGRVPRVGERFVQTDWARTLTFLADEDRRARVGGRSAGLAAARDAFYRGDVAARIVAYHRQEGGLLTREDLESFHVEVERPCRTMFRGHEVLTGGFWGQGPVLLQMLNLLASVDLGRLGHNSAEYVHQVVESMKLAFADREAYYGDPHYVDVPATELLSSAYADKRRALIREDRAWPDLPPARRSAPRPRRARGGGELARPLWRERRRPGDLLHRASSTRPGTRFRARRATCRPTRPSSRVSGFPSPPGVPSRGSIRPTPARWLQASVRGSPSARPLCCGTAGPCWSWARPAATSSPRRCSRSC